MPAAIAIPAIAAAIGGVASAYGAHRASSASNRATAMQSAANNQQLTFMQQQALEDKRRYDTQIAQEKAQWDAEQSRRQPFRDAAASAMALTGTRMNTAPKPFMPSAPPPSATGTIRASAGY